MTDQFDPLAFLRAGIEACQTVGDTFGAKRFTAAADELARLRQELEQIALKHDVACSTITRMQDERERLKRHMDEYSDVLRDLASYVGCGGYNSTGLLPPKVADEKIRYGIDHITRVETQRREAAEQERDSACRERDRYRQALEQIRDLRIENPRMKYVIARDALALARRAREPVADDGCRYCGMQHGYHDEKCPQRDLTHLADAPDARADLPREGE